MAEGARSEAIYQGSPAIYRTCKNRQAQLKSTSCSIYNISLYEDSGCACKGQTHTNTRDTEKRQSKKNSSRRQ